MAIMLKPCELCRELRQEELVVAAMAKHGLRSASKREKLLAAAQDDAEATLDAAVRPAQHCLLATPACCKVHK